MNPTTSRSLKPRKSPRQKRSEQLVATLLEAAAQVLERDGLAGFTTNAVAQRAGVGVGSLYQYFPNKNALVLALMEREGKLFHAAAARGRDMRTGAEGLSAVVQAAVHQQLHRPELARLLDTQQALPDLKAAVGAPNFLLDLIRNILDRADLPRQPYPDVAARDVLAIIRGLTDTAGEYGERSVSDLERRASAAVFGYLHGMSAPGV
jgi:AcrR family transcriptional regulator